MRDCWHRQFAVAAAAGTSTVAGCDESVATAPGPDGEGIWIHPRGIAGFAHRRLTIIDLKTGQQPMGDQAGNWVTYNGEIYNYLELREELGANVFRTRSDTEVILQAYRKWGLECLDHFRGMFAFSLWDEAKQSLLCARDPFGIKPFYYLVTHDALYFSSEAKTLLPFVPDIDTDLEGLKDYLTFQFCLDGKTLFKGIRELLPGHCLEMKNGTVTTRRYWEVYYHLDFDRTERYFEGKVCSLLEDSVALHLRSDVPVGAYVSGGSIPALWLPGLRTTAGCHRRFHGEVFHQPCLRREPVRAGSCTSSRI